MFYQSFNGYFPFDSESLKKKHVKNMQLLVEI